jgi:hypothetical protein
MALSTRTANMRPWGAWLWLPPESAGSAARLLVVRPGPTREESVAILLDPQGYNYVRYVERVESPCQEIKIAAHQKLSRSQSRYALGCLQEPWPWWHGDGALAQSAPAVLSFPRVIQHLLGLRARIGRPLGMMAKGCGAACGGALLDQARQSPHQNPRGNPQAHTPRIAGRDWPYKATTRTCGSLSISRYDIWYSASECPRCRVCVQNIPG